MLKLLAKPFADWSPFRAAWLILGIWFTYGLAPAAFDGIRHGFFVSLVEHYNEYASPPYRLGAIGFGALVGLAAAWCRVLISNPAYQLSSALFFSTVVGLVVGIVTAVVQLAIVSILLHWFYALVAFLGVWLLGATIGARVPPGSTALIDNRTSEAPGSP